MMITPEEVESVFEQEWTQTDDIDGSNETSVRQAAKVQALLDLFVRVQQLWSTEPDSVDKVVQKLADGARDESWRLPLGDAGILSFFSSIINVHGNMTAPLRIQILRLIGNCCAEMDENRVRLCSSDHLDGILKQLDDDETFPYAVTVLYNTLVDYEPIQIKASQAGLVGKIVDILVGPRLPAIRSNLEMTFKLLNLLAARDFETKEAPLKTPSAMLSLAALPTFVSEPGSFSSLVTLALLYLVSERLQIEFVDDPECMPVFLSVLETACTKIDLSVIEDADVQKGVKQLAPKMVSILADLSAVPSFSVIHPMDGPVMQSLQAWLDSRQVHLVSAACLTFGNAARSDAPSLALVETYRIHVPIITFVADNTVTDSQVLHCSLSFLKNLAIPTANKPVLGDAGLLDSHILPRIWSTHIMSEVQFAAVSLARLLLTNCSANVRRICASLPVEGCPETPGTPPSTTHLQSLITLFTKSDAEPIKLEASRAVAAVCREIHMMPIAEVLPSSNPVQGASRDAFYNSHPSLVHPLFYLITQSKFPLLRSEVFFTLAIMSRTLDGAKLVSRLLKLDGAPKALSETVLGVSAVGVPTDNNDEAAPEDEAGQNETLNELGLDGLEPKHVDDQQKENVARVDRENCLVMISELLKTIGNEMSPDTKTSLSNLLKDGGAIAVESRKTAASTTNT